MFDGFQMKAALPETPLSLALLSVASAQASQNEPSFAWVWATAVFFGCVGFLAWRRSPWLGGVAAVFSWAFIWVSAIDLDNPAPLGEARTDYINHVYLIVGVCVVLHLLGIAAHLRKKQLAKTRESLA